MITHLKIENFAVIENAEIIFNEGLNIVTGETGAGKSIMVEAISLALGARADTTFIRTGAERALVQMVFNHNENEYVITREINTSGRNLCKINGEIVSLSEVGKLSRSICDIHGQYDHQALLNPENHVTFIDSYKGSLIYPSLEKVRESFKVYKDLEGKLNRLISHSLEMERMKDFMTFQNEEIEKASLVPGEEEELTERKLLLQNSEKIYQSLNEAYTSIKGEDTSLLDNLYKAMASFKDISAFSPEIATLENELKETYYRLEEALGQALHLRDSINFSSNELDETLDRLDLIDSLKKKYGNSIDEILTFQKDIQEKLKAVFNYDETKETLEREIIEAEKVLSSNCDELTSLRKESAKELTSKIQNELLELGFRSAVLEAVFEKTHGYQETGNDKIEFLIMTNKGEDLKPLSKIASGGEMSRIMLAFKKIIADYDHIPSMIFDEIDAGISGIAASVVAKKLKQISINHQIICITHLPQIAAAGKYNYRIEKKELDNKTVTDITPLSKEEKVKEIARLLGGENITPITIRSAEELIEASI